jgi:hypothetical protein
MAGISMPSTNSRRQGAGKKRRCFFIFKAPLLLDRIKWDKIPVKWYDILGRYAKILG